MLNKLLGRSAKSSSKKSSLILQSASVTLSVVDGEEIFVEQLPCANNDFCGALTALSQHTAIADSTCQIVLGHGLYQIAQLEKPAVPDNEMAQALMWSAKDLVSIASENLVLDYFEYLSNNTNNNKINVVATDKTMIKPVTDLLTELEVNIQGISIVDIVLSQVINSSTPEVLVFHLPGMNVLLAVIKEGKLCFSRHINGYDNLHQLSEPDFAAGALNNLGLEIQRCIDFAIGQLKLEPVTNVSLFLQSLDSMHVVKGLQEFFDINVSLQDMTYDQAFARFPLSALAMSEMELTR